VVTDQGSYGWAKESLGEKFINKCFEHVIVEQRDYVYQHTNNRTYRDTSYNIKRLPFYNCDHFTAYDLTPYEETLFIDADYFVMSDALNQCWGSDNDVMVSHNIKEVCSLRDKIAPYIDPFSIKEYWATCIYFRKSELAENLFNLAKHVFDNYGFYRQLYHLPSMMFRNDHAFSIAIHMLNGFEENNMIPQLPIPYIYKLFDKDDIHSVNGLNDITFMVEKPNETGNYILTRTKDVDVHIMNKWAINRQADRLLELYK